MLTRNHYSMVVTGSRERVESIVKKHGETMRLGSFCGEKGFLFSVVEDGIGFSRLVKELEKCPDVLSVNFEHASEPA